jgi:hypothetical protein
MTDAFITQRPRCTWSIEKYDEDELDEDGEPTFSAHDCGRVATVVYVKKNPRRKEPDQPEYLRYPRCATHDTPEARRVAPTQGYDIEELP